MTDRRTYTQPSTGTRCMIERAENGRYFVGYEIDENGNAACTSGPFESQADALAALTKHRPGIIPEQPQTPAAQIAAALAGLPCLTERVTVYVPATSGVNAEADNAAEVDTIAARLSDWFGGATIQPGAGCWMSETAGLVKESTTTVYAACTVEQLAEHIAALRTLCENLKKEMGQEAIAMSVNQTLYFI